MVGSACWRALEAEGYTNLVGKTSKELDLRDQRAVDEYIKIQKPVAIIDAAAKVGGILANETYPYEFLMDNMLIQNNLIRSAHVNNVPKFIFLGSSCIYPKLAPQPLKEEYLLTDSLEPTNEWYAIAKISGVKLIEALRKEYGRDYVSLMPTNLYGPNDNFNLKSSHVLPAMIRKFHEAKLNGNTSVELWGTGSPMREFLHVDDLGQAVLLALVNKLEEPLYNVGTGVDLTIKDLAELIQSTVGHQGQLVWDSSKPDGTPRKLMDSSRLNDQGWLPRINLNQGIHSTYQSYLQNEI
jgi:GDP-L-fucose synthase